MDQEPFTSQSGITRKQLFIAGGIVLAMIATVVITLILVNQPRQSNQPQEETGPTSLEFGFNRGAVSYASNLVYDACNLLSIETVKNNTDDYENSLDYLGSDRTLTEPLVLEHVYIDRTIDTPLGRDAEPRPVGVSIGPGGPSQNVTANSFISTFDSYCIYGQGRSFSTEFAKVYIIQKPTPFAPEFTAYLNSLAAQNQKTDVGDAQLYNDPTRDSNGFLTVILVKGTTAVFVRSGNQELLQVAGEEVAAKLRQSATGPMTVAYPRPYQKLINPCELLSANDFESLMGLPASSTVHETLFLTESDDHIAERSCDRLEVERLNRTLISNVEITLRQARTDSIAKGYLENLDGEENTSFQPLQIALGDESFIKIDKLQRSESYSLMIRKGNSLLEVETSGEAADPTAADFERRAFPIAKLILENFENLSTR